MFASRSFQFRPILTVFFVLGLMALLSLGGWQLQRLQWKHELIAAVEERAGASPISFEEARQDADENYLEYTPVNITGVYESAGEVRVFGSHQGVAGAFVFTPMRTADSRRVYINRGFVPQARIGGEPAVAPNAAPVGMVEVTGLFRYAEQPRPPASWLLPKAASSDGWWLRRDPTLFAGAAGPETSPYYVDAYAVAGVEWPKGGLTRVEFNNRHLEYALTWFGLAATLLVIWLTFSLPKRH